MLVNRDFTLHGVCAVCGRRVLLGLQHIARGHPARAGRGASGRGRQQQKCPGSGKPARPMGGIS